MERLHQLNNKIAVASETIESLQTQLLIAQERSKYMALSDSRKFREQLDDIMSGINDIVPEYNAIHNKAEELRYGIGDYDDIRILERRINSVLGVLKTYQKEVERAMEVSRNIPSSQRYR